MSFRMCKAGAVLAVASLLAAACGSSSSSTGGSSASSPAASGFDLRIGTVLPFTGALSTYGPSLNQAAVLAVNLVNQALAQAGLSRDKVTLVGEEDDQTAVSPGVQAAQKLVSTNHADVIVGSMASSVTIAIVNTVAVPNNVLVISPTSSDPSIAKLNANHLVWTIYPPDNLQGRALATAAAGALGAHAKVNVAAENNAFGAALSQDFDTTWRAGGGTVGTTQLYDPTSSSLDSVASALTSGAPAGWVIIAYPTSFGVLAPALVRTGKWSPARTFVTESLQNQGVLNKIGAAQLSGLRGTAGAPPQGPVSAAFEAYFKAHAAGKPFTGFEGTAFDAVILAALAAVRAHSADPLKIRDSLQAVSGPAGAPYSFQNLAAAFKAAAAGSAVAYQGAWGNIDWEADGSPGSALYQLWRYAGGQISVLRTFRYQGGA